MRKLIVGDKCLGMLEAVGEVFPKPTSAVYRPLYRNVFSVTPRSKVKLVNKMLKDPRPGEQASARELRGGRRAACAMAFERAAKKVDGIEETPPLRFSQ